MKSWFIGITVAMVSVAVVEAQAAEQPYAGVDVSATTFTTSNAEVSPVALRFRAGSELGSVVGVEGQALIGVQGDSVQLATGTMDVSIQAAFGVYLRPKLALGDSVAVYGLVGYAWSSIKADPNIFGLVERSRTFGDVSGGGGIEAKVFGDNYLSVDYMEYTEGLTAVSAGIRIPF